MFRYFREAIKSVLTAKTRTALSALCIGLGIAGVSFVTALGAAAVDKAQEMMSMFGTDAVMIFSGSATKHAHGMRSMTLYVEDAANLRQNFPDAYLVAPMRFHPGLLVAYKNAKLTSDVEGITTSLKTQWDWEIGAGRDLVPEDNLFNTSACIIGSYINDNLFGEEDALGKQIKLGTSSCEVVGVAVKRSMGAFDDEMNTFVIIPETVFTKKYAWRKNLLMGIRMRFYNITEIDRLTEEVRSFLRHQHNLAEGEEDDFRIFTPSTISRMFMAVLGAIGAFLAVITLVVVVVGGFVTANMFLLATQTRVKEIGIRRAFGAGAGDIFAQFIIEFIVVAFIGMLVGLGIAAAAAAFVSSYGLVEVKITPVVFGVTALFTLLIALIFGTLPAKSASKISPIEAIRSL